VKRAQKKKNWKEPGKKREDRGERQAENDGPLQGEALMNEGNKRVLINRKDEKGETCFEKNWVQKKGGGREKFQCKRRGANQCRMGDSERTRKKKKEARKFTELECIGKKQCRKGDRVVNPN